MCPLHWYNYIWYLNLLSHSRLYKNLPAMRLNKDVINISLILFVTEYCKCKTTKWERLQSVVDSNDVNQQQQHLLFYILNSIYRQNSQDKRGNFNERLLRHSLLYWGRAMLRTGTFTLYLYLYKYQYLSNTERKVRARLKPTCTSTPCADIAHASYFYPRRIVFRCMFPVAQ